MNPASLDTKFAVEKDMQGNVVKLVILNSGPVKTVAEYEYDAFGNPTVTPTSYTCAGSTISTSSENHIANLTPFLWKGHYWDNETELYEIGGNYYDPTTGRFVSPVNIKQSMLTGESPYAMINPLAFPPNSATIYSDTLNGGYGGGFGLGGFGGNGRNNKFLTGLENVFDKVDFYSDFLSSGAGAGLGLFKSGIFKKVTGFFDKFGVGMAILGFGVDTLLSGYNNFSNPNLTTGQQWASFGMDIGYNAVKTGAQFALGLGAGKLAGAVGLNVAIGLAILGMGPVGAALIGIGVAVAIGAGAMFAIYHGGKWLDEQWKNFKNWLGF